MGAFPRDSHLTSIAIAYRNPLTGLMADFLLPRIRVAKREFKYFSYPEAAFYTIPKTRVSPKGRIGTVDIEGVQDTASCEDYGIGIPVSQDDIDNAPEGMDPKAHATERSMNIVLMDREREVAGLVFNTASYPTGNKKDLSVGDLQFDNPDANALKTVKSGLDSCLIRPNRVGFGQEAWAEFSQHPSVVSAANKNSGTSGQANRVQVAELLEVDEVQVGRSFINVVKPGKAPTFARVWGNMVSAVFIDPTVDNNGGVTFGFTAEYGQRFAGSKDIDMGLDGGVEVRAGERRKELIVAPKAGFLFHNTTGFVAP